MQAEKAFIEPKWWYSSFSYFLVFLMNFPDQDYLLTLRERMLTKTETTHDLVSQLLAYAGMELNWIGDFISDENIEWQKEEIEISKLFLTGMNPEWNYYIKTMTNGSPEAMSALMKEDALLQNMCKELPDDSFPILVRKEGEELKVLDGMNRTLKALWDNKTVIEAYTAYPKGNARPWCEAHVVYDVLRAYQRGLNTNREDCIAALRFLKNSYGNVEYLLKTRFSKAWVDYPELQSIIAEALM